MTESLNRENVDQLPTRQDSRIEAHGQLLSHGVARARYREESAPIYQQLRDLDARYGVSIRASVQEYLTVFQDTFANLRERPVVRVEGRDEYVPQLRYDTDIFLDVNEGAAFRITQGNQGQERTLIPDEDWFRYGTEIWYTLWLISR